MGKNIIKGLVGVAAVAAIGYGVYSASRPQVGIINFAEVQKKAKVYMAAAEQQKKYDEAIQQIILKDKDFIKLQEDGNKLVEQQKTLSKEEFESKSASLQSRAMKINERYRDSFERNAMASQMALKSVEKEIEEAFEATAKKTGAKVLLPVNIVLYKTEAADVSDVFVQELDKRVQKVNYPNPVTLK